LLAFPLNAFAGTRNALSARSSEEVRVVDNVDFSARALRLNAAAGTADRYACVLQDRPLPVYLSWLGLARPGLQMPKELNAVLAPLRIDSACRKNGAGLHFVLASAMSAFGQVD
jgi:hypothetical protein